MQVVLPVYVHAQYCTPSPNNCSGEGITNVTFGSINNTTTSCSSGGYANYTANVPAPVITRGSSVPISLGLKVNSSGGAAIWIDYDHSNSFTTDECTLIAPVSGTNVTVTGSVPVPATALTGPTRMRVRETYATPGYPGSHAVAAGSACLSNDYTEFEDYQVNIQDPCSGTPVAGATASSATSVCPGTSFTLSLNGAVSAPGISYQWFSSPAGTATFGPVSGATNATLTTSQTASTDYYCQLTCANGGQSANSTTLTVTMNPFMSCYCTPSYASGCSGDNIASVSLGSLTESGLGCMGYTNRTTAQTGSNPTLPVPSIFGGTNSTLTLTFGSDNNQFSAAWIDLNHNGVFDTNEYFSTNSNAGANGTASITLAIPATALAGQTRMRIRGGDDYQLHSSLACGPSNSSYGTARDYLVNIIQVTAPPACITAPTAPADGANACVQTSGTTLSWPAVTDAFSYDVYLDQGTATTLVTTVSGTSYTTAAPLSAGNYSWKVIPKNTLGSATGCSTFTFMVNILPLVSVTPASGITCASVMLTAAGASTYAWSPATGLSATTGASVTATPPAVTAYTVTGTDNNGCSNTATTTITPIGAVMPNAPAQTICPGPASVTLAPVTPIAGTMEYELTDTLGNVLAGWQNNNIFTVTPAHSGLNKYFTFARNTGCPSDISDTGLVTVFSGFSAVVTANNASCINGDGSLTISDPLGAGLYNSGTWYSNNFSSATIADTNAVALRGGAVITSNALQLTPNTASQNGGFLVKNPQGINQNVDSVKFILSVPQNGADGLSWSFADNIAYNSNSQLESGAGNKLIISFDAYTNSNSNAPGAAGIYLTYGLAGGSNIPVTVSATMLAYSSNTSWRGTSNTPIAIYITPAGKLTLKVGTTTVFNQVQLPAAYVNADRSSWQHLFAARTGGVSEKHVIDNLDIYYSGTTFVYGSTSAHSNTPPVSWQSSNSFAGLSGGDSLDIWIANPANPVSCNQKLGTYGVSGPAVATLQDSGVPSCSGATDGYIAIGVNAPGTYSATYSVDGGAPVTQTGLTTQNNGATDYIAIANLASGSYSNLKVVSAAGCNSNVIAGPVALADPGMTAIAGGSFTVTGTQTAPGTQYYTDNACGAIVAINSNYNLGNVSASVTVGGPVSTSSGEPFLGRYYEVTPAANNTMPVGLTLYFDPSDFSQYNSSSLVGSATYPTIASDGSNLRVRAYHGLPSSGTTGPNGAYDATNADLIAPSSVMLNSNGFWEVTFNSPNGFSGFFANTNTGTPLYLELGELSAANEGTVNRLRWNTLKEKAGDRFEIERSSDARNFSRIGDMPARGSAPSTYTFTDKQPLPGIGFYRLRLIHSEGGVTYSKTVQATLKGRGFLFDAYPNPAQETLTIKLSEVNGTGLLTLRDLSGRVVLEQPVDRAAPVTLRLAQLAAGTYLLQYKDEAHTSSLKINKQ